MPQKILLPLLLGLWATTFAQQPSFPIRAGVFLPYGLQAGAKIGTWHQMTEWASSKGAHQLWLAPQLGYFAFPGVQHNYLLQADLEYQYRKGESRIFPRAAIGFGYLFAAQRVDGRVDLGTGEMSHTTRGLHYLCPTLSLGLGIAAVKRVGYYVSGFYGRKLGLGTMDDAYFGLELGLIFSFANQTRT